MNRLCIYVVYDKDGIIDDYIPYFLNALKPFVRHMIIVCNGNLNDEGRAKLSQFTEDVFVRPNEGYDAGAVRDTLLNLYGWEKILQFDELLIANDTFYAPLYPLDECFGKMDAMNVDFWGWLLHREQLYNELHLSEYVQSYFYNIKSRMLHSHDFMQYFKQMKTAINAYEAFRYYEENLSVYFAQKGYTYGTYLKPLKETIGVNYNPFIDDAVELVEDFHCPFIKRKALQRGVSDVDANQYETRKSTLLELVNEIGYDSRLILNHLDRIGNPIFTLLQPKEVWLDFAIQAKKIYIYGAGNYAAMVATVLEKHSIDYMGFIVTDGHAKHDEFHSHPCVYLSEVKFDDDTGVILGLDSKNRAQVEPLLVERGMKNFIAV